jgi:conjugal transfer pilus assembly protein TraE
MKISSFLNEHAATAAENRLLKFAVIFIGIVTLINSVATYMALNKQRTIVVPPVIDSRFEISGKTVSEDYLKMMTRYVVNLVLNYTPHTARGQMDEALRLFAPEGYAEAKKMFYQLADTIETAKVTNVFHIQKITVDGSRRTIEIQGDKRQFVNEQKTGEVAVAVYMFDYRLDNGKFMLTRFYPKTQEK